MCDAAHIGDKYRRTRVNTVPRRDGPTGRWRGSWRWMGMAADARLGSHRLSQAPGVLPGGRLPAANMRKVLARPSAISTIEMVRSLFSPAGLSCLGGG